MVLVETGSNYETKSENGLSHFLEHMCFKGTKKRPKSIDISRELDSLGAENNAFTSREMTGYYAKGEKKHFRKLLDVISDMYLSPTLPKEDLEKERGVILQEISMYEDLPKRKVWDELWTLLYGETPAGRPIIGPVKNIKKFSRSDFVNYRRRHYIAEKTIIIVAGDVNARKAVAEVKKYFKTIPRGKKIQKPKVAATQKAPALRVHKKSTDQTHMIMAFRAFGAGDKKMGALYILSEVLGQGMSSRLWQKMREELGACYYIGAHANNYSDYGILSIAIGIESHRAVEVTSALLEECHKLRDTLVPESELEKAKEHFLGHLYMGLETTDSLADFYGDQEISAKKLKTPSEIEKEIRKLTAEDIRRMAREVFRDEKLNLAIVGDISDSKGIKKTLTLG